MNDTQSPLPAPFLLTIAYAPQGLQDRLSWLIALDQRLLSVLQRASEPMIAQLRLSWWRDALNSPPENRPKGEPLLAKLEPIDPDSCLAGVGLDLVDAYEVMATETGGEALVVARRMRIEAVVHIYAGWLGLAVQDLDSVVAYWADAVLPMPKSLPRSLRPLTIWALAERLENADTQTGIFGRGIRLNWHALTGR